MDNLGSLVFFRPRKTAVSASLRGGPGVWRWQRSRLELRGTVRALTSLLVGSKEALLLYSVI